MKKTVCMVITLFLVLSIVSFPTAIFSESTDLIPNTYYDAAQIFTSSTAETDGFTMSPAQNKDYSELGDNIFGVPEEQDDGNWFLPEKSMVTNWNSSTTKSFSINVTSAGEYSVYLLAREYNSRGFSITMSGTKIDGSTYNETYLTNYKNGENTEGISGQVRVGVSVAAKNANLGVHYAIFKDLAVGTHNLEITYSGDSGSSVGYFYGLNVYQTQKYQEPCATITSAENINGELNYVLDVPNSVTEKNYDYFIALRDSKGMLKDVRYNESQGKFGNVSGNEYTITAYTWTKQMEPIGMDTKKGYAELNISADKGVDIDEGPIGLFFEDLNYNCDGGLYAEQIENRSFEQQIVTGDGNIVDAVTREPGYAWTSGNGTVNYLTDLPLNDKNTYYAQLSGSTSGASLINKAYEGVYVEQGKDYRFSVWARKGLYTGDISVSVSKGGETSVQGTLALEPDTQRDDGWAKYSVSLPANKTISKADYTISLNTLAANETVDIDMVSMFPEDAVNGIFRRDMAESIKDINPGFLRFPGGCIVEGYDLSNRYQWKDTVGPIESRPQIWNRWANKSGAYNETYGLGFYEYFILCEYLNCKALPILNVGLACEFNTSEAVPVFESDNKTYTAEFQTYLQDALDLVEFANGSAETTWGKVRAEMGHPEPFNLEMIGIGNEQWEKDGNQWYERYEAFEKNIHAVYPDIKLITSAGPDVTSSKYTNAWTWIRKQASSNPSFTFAVDEHNYNTKEWFFENDTFYDNYKRNVNVYLGEYAAKGYTSEDGQKRSNDLISAISEAAFLTGIERNADIVKMSSYAPLFARSKPYSQWAPDMIWYNDTSLYKTPNYYVQKMYSNNMGDYTLKSEINEPTNQRIYQTTSYDEETNEIIVKLVNPSDETNLVIMNLDETFNLSGKVTANLLTSEQGTDANSFNDPNKVIDKTYNLENIISNESSNTMNIDLEPCSLTIFRIQLK